MRKPSEKVTVRLFPSQIRYLINLLEKQSDVSSQIIADRLGDADLQHFLKEQKWEKEKGTCSFCGSCRPCDCGIQYADIKR